VTDESRLIVYAGQAAVEIMPYSEHVVRLSLSPDGTAWPESSLVVVTPPSQVAWSFSADDSNLAVSVGDLVVQVSKFPVRIRCLRLGQTVLVDANGFWWEADERGVDFRLSVGEAIYGAGERAVGLNLRWQYLESYNRPDYCYGEGAENLNITVPLLLSSTRAAVYFDNPWPGAFDIGGENPGVLHYQVSGGELAYYLIADAEYPDLIKHYTWLTGRQPIPPLWALGYLQSRYGYERESQARTVVQAMHDARIPFDALILDLYWFGWGQMGDFDWDYSAWPNPATMMQQFAATGIKTILITEPYILQSSSNFSHCAANGLLAVDSTGAPVVLPDFWAGAAGLMDITDSTARTWWWSEYERLAQQGVGGWWCDLGEPEAHPAYMQHDAGPADKVHNSYSLRWAAMLHDGYREHFPEQRLFNLIRSGYAGMQRYGTFPWSGDVQRSFSGLRAQLPIMLTMGLCGIAYTGFDIAGFDCGERDSELYIRWIQLGTFAPVMRAHGVGVPTEPIYYDGEIRDLAKQYIELRYCMLPYNYSLAYENSMTGLPLARPLILEYRNPALMNRSDEYLWGPSLLVAPVIEEDQSQREVTLPEGIWIDFWTDRTRYGPGTITADAPLDRIPVFVKAGAVLPFGPVKSSTSGYRMDTLHIHCYPDVSEPGGFALYEDDGTDPAALEQNRFNLIRIENSAGPTSVDVQCSYRQQGYAEAPQSRRIVFEIHRIPNAPDSVLIGGVRLSSVASLQDLLEADSAWFWSPVDARLHVAASAASLPLALHVEGAAPASASARSGAVVGSARIESFFPNPWNSEGEITFVIPHEGRVTLTLYSVLGREVATLTDARYSAGRHMVHVAASGLASGVYLCRLQAGGTSDVQKTVLIK